MRGASPSLGDIIPRFLPIVYIMRWYDVLSIALSVVSIPLCIYVIVLCRRILKGGDKPNGGE